LSPSSRKRVTELSVDPDLSKIEKEDFLGFCKTFQRYTFTSYKFRPSKKQLDFTEHYLKTGDPIAAYTYAGYAPLEKYWPRYRRLVWWRVLHSKNVQLLLRMAMYQWASRHDINPTAIADRLLKIADTTDDLKTAVSALRELNCMLGYHRDSGQKMGDQRKKRKAPPRPVKTKDPVATIPRTQPRS